MIGHKLGTEGPVWRALQGKSRHADIESIIMLSRLCGYTHRRQRCNRLACDCCLLELNSLLHIGEDKESLGYCQG